MMMPKFVQITCSTEDLYALDEEGGVWRYEGLNGWVALRTIRRPRQ